MFPTKNRYKKQIHNSKQKYNRLVTFLLNDINFNNISRIIFVF